MANIQFLMQKKDWYGVDVLTFFQYLFKRRDSLEFAYLNFLHVR